MFLHVFPGFQWSSSKLVYAKAILSCEFKCIILRSSGEITWEAVRWRRWIPPATLSMNRWAHVLAEDRAGSLYPRVI